MLGAGVRRAETIRVGLAGLGGASARILPAFSRVEGVELVAGADVGERARAAFSDACSLPACSSVEELCRRPDVDAVYVATPNRLHSEHAVLAARAGKHVVCEKPMAVTLDECDRMMAAVEDAGVLLVQGYSKIFATPLRAMREIIDSGRLGRVIHLDSWNFNDWLRRPRTAEEVDSRQEGGVVLRQAPIQVEIAMYLLGGVPRAVRATTGRWCPRIATEGNFAALIEFEDQRTASLSFNGYGYLNIEELLPGAGSDACWEDRIPPVQPDGVVSAGEKYMRNSRRGGNARSTGSIPEHPFSGLTIVHCERGALRQSRDGLFVYTDEGREEVAVPPDTGRAAGLAELRDAIREGRPARPDGSWGRALVAVCLAIPESSRTGRDVCLRSRIDG